MIGLISCVKSKANRRCEAKDMYVSPLFKYMYAYAKKRCKEVYILSAKYGLLSENTPIAPYNITLNSMSERQKKEWAKNIMLSLSKRYDLNNDGVINSADLLLLRQMLNMDSSTQSLNNTKESE